MALSMHRPRLLLTAFLIGLVTISLLYLQRKHPFLPNGDLPLAAQQSLKYVPSSSITPVDSLSTATSSSTISSPSSFSSPLPTQTAASGLPSTTISNTTLKPRIGLINLWHSSHLSPYIDAFFHTASVNADILSLLFINLDVNGSGCANPPSIATSAPNIHFVCLSRSDFFDMLADFFCSEDFWSCESEEALDVVRREIPRKGSDYTRDHGLTYRPLVLPAMKGLWPNGEVPSWVGWSDTDLMFGSVERFLGGIVRQEDENADVITFSVTGPDQWRMYLRGQLTLFRTEAEVEKAYLQVEEWESWKRWVEGFGLPEDVDDFHRGEEEGYWSSKLADVMAEGVGSVKKLRWLQMTGLQGGDQSMLSLVHRGTMVKSIYNQVVGLWEVPYDLARTQEDFWAPKDRQQREKQHEQQISVSSIPEKGSLSVSVSHVCPEHFVGSLDHRRCVHPIPALPPEHGLQALSYSGGKVELITMPQPENGRTEKLFQHFLWVKHNAWMRVPDFGIEGGWGNGWVYEVDAWGQTRLWDHEKGGKDVGRGTVEGHY